MDFFETSSASYSYRGKYAPAPVPKEDLVKILQAGVDSPTGCNMQTAYFVAVTDGALRAEIAKIVPGKNIATAPAFVLILSENKENPRGDYHVQDYSAAAQSILLAIADLGYAGVWLEGQLNNGDDVKLAQLLNVPQSRTVEILIPLGVPEDTKRPNKKKLGFDEMVQFERY